MTFDEWLNQNGTAIKQGWDAWCVYYGRYRHNFSADFRIPVPQFYLDGLINKDPQLGPKTLAHLKQQFEIGKPVSIPPPVPAPPSNNFAGRAIQHGQASKTAGEAAWRGAKEGFKSQAGKAAMSILGSIFKR